MNEHNVCIVHVARPGAVDRDLLNPLERTRWLRYRHRADRDRFATGVGLLAGLSIEVAGHVLPRTRRCAGCGAHDHGPVDLPGWSVSLSHSGDRVVAAIAPAVVALGVDVERIRDFTDGVAALAFSQRERDADAACGPFAGSIGPHAIATTRWARKEAVLKAARTGITVPLADLEVSAAGEAARVQSWAAKSRPHDIAVADIVLRDLDLGAGYRAALAAHGETAAALDVRGPVLVSPRSVDGHPSAIGSQV